MKDTVQILIELFDKLNDAEKIILHNHIVYNINQNIVKKEIKIDYDQIMSLSWF